MESTSSSENRNTIILAAAKALSTSLNDSPYAIVGGAACALLGSTRELPDFDIVVPRGETASTRALLKHQDTLFEVEPRKLHTFFNSGHSRVQIKILTPPGMFRGTFDAETRTIELQGVKILHPVLILNELCSAIMGRWSEERKKTDADNILFLLKWLAKDDGKIRWADVPNVDRDFATWFVGEYGGGQIWRGVEKKMID